MHVKVEGKVKNTIKKLQGYKIDNLLKMGRGRGKSFNFPC